MIVLLLVAVVSATPRGVFGGHYKIRAPPPPPVPPANIHYGPHPPPHRPLPSSSYLHPYRSPPPPPYYPHSPSGYHHPRIPHYYHKSTPREYHHRLAAPIYQQPKLAASYVPAIAAIPAAPAIPAPPPSTYGLWSNYAAFRAPVVQESFNPPPATYTASASLIKDDDKGPIHTIPAPNLGGGPDAAHLQAAASNSLGSSFANHYHKKQDPEADLVAVLRHGIQNVNVPHSPSYQVTEDPSIHTPEKDTPLHFAPDPDPDTPTLRVPATNDPHSIPSNGQVPLDIYLQQEADKQAATTESSNTLTAQDLFNLLNYQPAAPHSQSVSLYNAESLLQQAYPNAQFSPQFQTFNYDERTQQGAYGSNSFPTASMSLDLANADLSGSDNLLALKNFHDNDLAGSEKDEVFHKIVDPDNEIDPKREEHKKKSLEKKESTVGKSELVTRAPKHPSSNDLSQANPKFEIRVPQDIKDKIKKDILGDRSVPCPPGTSCVLPVATQPTSNSGSSKPDDGVQLQKSIQIYSTTYTTSVDDGVIPAVSSTTKPTEKRARGLVMAEVTESGIDPESANSNLPFGARIRPKRY